MNNNYIHQTREVYRTNQYNMIKNGISLITKRYIKKEKKDIIHFKLSLDDKIINKTEIPKYPSFKLEEKKFFKFIEEYLEGTPLKDSIDQKWKRKAEKIE